MRTAIDIYVIEKVKEMRTERRISQEDLSIALGFKSNGFVGQVESSNYRKRYNIGHLDKLAKILRCSPRDFLPELPTPVE